MSITVLALAALFSFAAPAAVENENACWRDSGRSGPKGWGRYDYHLVNGCDKTIHVWDAVVLRRDGKTDTQWSCGHGTAAPDEIERSGCRPLVIRPGGTFSYSTGSEERYFWFACDPDDARCNELAKEWADDVHGRPSSFDPKEFAKRTGF